MTQEAPGKFFRNGISLMKLVAMLPDEHAAVRRFEEQRWPEQQVLPALRINEGFRNCQPQAHAPSVLIGPFVATAFATGSIVTRSQ